MRKLLFIFIILSIASIFLYFGYSGEEQSTTINNDSEKRGIFISYIELSKYVKNGDVEVSKKNIDQMIDNIYKLGFNLIVLQVRSFSDAIYPSDIFPWSSTVSSFEGIDPGYDILGYFLEKAHSKNIALYAWINPYRVRTTEDVLSITEDNPAYSYLDTEALWIEEGIFYNPSKQEVEDLVVEGVLEIVKKYSVDGILFDDYFYPNSDIDLNDYNLYLEEHDFISLDQYHLMIVNKMVKRVHDICSAYDVDFGVSPDGNISNNYTKVFADVKKWGSSSEYVDFIMPQIYYGFYNETKAFKMVVEEWEQLVTNENVSLMIALAFYKVGTVDQYAKSGSLEWTSNHDIIMREIILSRNLENYKGFSLFRYGYLFDPDLYTDTTMLEIENMKKVLK